MNIFAPGQVLAGRFVVEACIGSGGMAEVYRVRHRLLGSRHAVKVLRAPRGGAEAGASAEGSGVRHNPGMTARLLQEGRIQAQLRHPNIVTVTDVLEEVEGVALVMEFIEGEPLDTWSYREDPRVPEILDVFAGVVAGVQAAHAAGVLHRDLKPANVLLQREGDRLVPKVSDFGIAKILLNQPGDKRAVLVGTPGYIAPELLRGAPPAPTGDVFALGAILYELLAGRPPWTGADVAEILRNTQDVPFAPLPARPDLPPGLDEVVYRALASDPNERTPSVDALAAALAPFAPGRFTSRTSLAPRIVVPTGVRSPTLMGDALRDARPETLDESAIVAEGVVSVLGARPTAVAPDPQATWPPPTPAPGRATVRPSGPLRAAAWSGLLLVGLGAVVVLGLGGATAAWWWSQEEVVSAPMIPVSPAPVQGSGAVPPAPEVAPSAENDAPAAPVPTPAPQAPASSGAPPPVRAATSPVNPEVVPAPVAPPTSPGAEASPIPEPVAAAAPEVVEPPVEATPEPVWPELAGRWAGTANKKPMRLQLSQKGGTLNGEVVFVLGPTERVIKVAGTVEADGSVVLRGLSGSEDVFRGKLAGGALSGTYAGDGDKALSWSVERR